ncbi:hypothetical protein EXD76_09575 [BEV proteobacterium]|nr:hypothetical protein [Candidatus Symbiopectobacterium sp. Chty_BC]
MEKQHDSLLFNKACWRCAWVVAWGVNFVVIKVWLQGMPPFLLAGALLNKSELVTTVPHIGLLLRDANTVRHS